MFETVGADVFRNFWSPWQWVETKWGGWWEKVHNVKIFNFCFFKDSYRGFHEETSVENRLKKDWGISKLRHFLWHAFTCIFMTRQTRKSSLRTKWGGWLSLTSRETLSYETNWSASRIYDTSWFWSRFSPLSGCGSCVPFRMSRPKWRWLATQDHVKLVYMQIFSGSVFTSSNLASNQSIPIVIPFCDGNDGAAVHSIICLQFRDDHLLRHRACKWWRHKNLATRGNGENWF